MSHPGETERASNSGGVVYRFGAFELDPARETLVGPDAPVALRGHALLVLKLLIERAPQVVSRDDILDEVWGHQALSESSIAQVIRDIRAALNDSARTPTLVATRYGRGYQFVGDVQRIERESAPPDTGAATGNTSNTSPGPRRRTRIVVLAMILLMAMVALQWMRGPTESPDAETGPRVVLRAVAAGAGDSLSEPFVDYIAFVIGQAIGSDQVSVLDEDEEPPVDASAEVIEVSLAALETADGRQLELALGRPALEDPALRRQFDQASQLVRQSFDEILGSLEYDQEIALNADLVSQSSYAIETLLRGMAAQFAGDVGRAAELFEAALAEDPEFEFARYELAIAVRRNGDYQRALAILEPMSRRLDSEFWIHRIFNAMGIAYWQLDRLDEALAALRRAESAATSPATRAIALSNIGLIERNLGRLEPAESALRESLRLAETADRPRLLAAGRNSLASVLIRLGRTEEALVELGLARELFYETGNLRGYGAVLSRTARIHSARGERNEEESLLRLALGIREQIDDPAGIADIQFRLARIHRVRGEFDQARALAREALNRAQSLENDGLLIDTYQALATLALADRRYNQARSYGNEALRLAELTGRDEDIRAVRLGLLNVDLETATGPDTLEARLDQLVRDADAADHGLVAIRARLLAARLYRQLKHPEDARRVLERAGELLDPNDVRFANEVDAERARLALDRDDPDAAGLALDAMERRNAPEFPTLMLRARLHAARGNLKAAVEAANLARANTGDWWTTEDQALLDRWSADIATD